MRQAASVRLSSRFVALAGALLFVPAASAVAPNGFRLPSGNIGCIYNDASLTGRAWLRCDIRSGLRPVPRKACELDWTGLVFPTVGKPKPECAGDTAIDPRARVIPYGGRWARGGYTCLSQRIGLRCTRRNGHGLFLSRTSWRVY
jgi:hypothetical protein